MPPITLDILRSMQRTGKNLLPVVFVIVCFQLVLGQLPERLPVLILALLSLLLGMTLLLKAMDWLLFPLGNTLSHELASRGSLAWLLLFGFTLGFGAVIAEPSLLAVAEEAARLSEGRFDPTILRVVVAASVGLALMLAILRTVLGHGIHLYLIGGFLLLLLVTWLTPAEVTGIAMDAGAVSVNIITVPLLVALGLGLSMALAERPPLATGFGLLALAVMAPRIAVQLYGLLVYGDFGPLGTPDWAGLGTLPPLLVIPDTPIGGLLGDGATILQSVLPILTVTLLFQLLVVRQPLAHPRQLFQGFLWLLAGLFLFLQGLRYGLFPLGESMATALLAEGKVYLLAFVFLIGVSATMVEPALIAITRKAEGHEPTLLNARLLRWLAAFGVGLGLMLGIARMDLGIPLEWLLTPILLTLALLAWWIPRETAALAYDLGGVATSDVTVPLITAISIALTGALGSGDAMLDAFGLIALASLCPILLVSLYTLAAVHWTRHYLD